MTSILFGFGGWGTLLAALYHVFDISLADLQVVWLGILPVAGFGRCHR